MNNIAHFLDFELDTGAVCFYPRPETEILVEKAVDLLSAGHGRGLPRRIMDIGTGCGSIAISLTKYLPSSKIVALDISDSALRIAGENALKYAAEDRIDFIKSDLFEGIDRNQYKEFFDLIISNPPYISLGEFQSLPAKTRDDPYMALSGGRDGMNFYRKIKNEAPFFLKKNGLLLLEVGYDQSETVKAILASSGDFFRMESYKDYSGIDRILKAEKWTNF